MSYRCVATSRAGFIQQLAVGYISNGYYFYVAGVIPSEKSAARVDAKILAAYDIAISKWTRSRRKVAGQANVQYLRHGRFYVIIATNGVHPFFEAEAKTLRDIRKTPILFMGYSIGCRRERGRGEYHASVRINRDTIHELKHKLVGNATKADFRNLYRAFQTLPFEPYAPVRIQLCSLLRAVNRARAVAGLELLPQSALRLTRSPVRPFEPEGLEESAVLFRLPTTTDLGE
jgi:hypothetical protein